MPEHQREPWAERVAIMVIDSGLPHADAERLAWESFQTAGVAPCGRTRIREMRRSLP